MPELSTKTIKPTTAIAFDFGLRSIGAAYGQTLTASAQELPPIRAKDGIPNWQVMEKLVKEWKPDIFVVGIPFNMDGSESELSKRAKKFGRRLENKFDCIVHFMDERLSSFEAKEEAREKGHKGNYREQPIDSIAARLILESWFNTKPSN